MFLQEARLAYLPVGRDYTRPLPVINEQERTPFPIRIHHGYQNYELLVRGRRSPEGMSAEMLNDYRRAEKQGDRKTKARHRRSRRDTIGSGKRAHESFAEFSTQIGQLVLSLPDDYPVRVFENMPDSLCDGCIVGKHCRRKYADDGTDVSTTDKILMDRFLRTSERLGLQDQTTLTTEEVTYTDAPPELARVVTTTFGIFKQVIVN